MYARVSTYTGASDEIDEAIRQVRDDTLPKLVQLDGYKGAYFLVDRQNGKSLAVTLWESEEAMRATEGASYWLRAFGAEAAGGEVTALERYEVVSSEVWGARP